MNEALTPAVRHSEEQHTSGSVYGSEQGESRGTTQRMLLTCDGRIEIPLTRSWCRECHQWCRPAETCLAIVKEGAQCYGARARMGGPGGQFLAL